MLTNKVGLEQASFLVDVDTFDEAWVHPVLSYQSQEIAEIPISRKTVEIKTTVTYLDIAENNS